MLPKSFWLMNRVKVILQLLESFCQELSPINIYKEGNSIKTGFVAVVGLPNAGKSTIINGLFRDRLLITSEKSQTTRKPVRCILTGEDYQMVLVDTPGLHQPRNKLGEFMQKEALHSLENSDVILYILDAVKSEPNFLEVYSGSTPIVLVLNKIDLLSQKEVDALVEKYKSNQRLAATLPASALTYRGLDRIVEVLKSFLPEGDLMYPEDQLMDCDYRFLAEELIREQALLLLDDEVPHGIAVEIDEFREQSDEAFIAANLIVERDSHKGIVIGRGGKMLGKIGKTSRLEIQKLMDKKVHLKLWVKVRKNWRKDPTQLKWLGYK